MMFARKIHVELVEPEGDRACPLAWLDSFAMRSFTGRSAFDATLPAGDGLLEVGLLVNLSELRHDMEDWLARKFGGGRPVILRFTEEASQP